MPVSGEVFLAGRRVPSDPVGAAKHGVAVVWQSLDHGSEAGLVTAGVS